MGLKGMGSAEKMEGGEGGLLILCFRRDQPSPPPSISSPLIAITSRRLRAFKRWMSSHSVLYSHDALLFDDDPGRGIAVIALRDLHEGEVIASIPKSACLSVHNSGAREIVMEADLDGILGLSVALMYEKSLGNESPWDGYLQLLPHEECLPLLWSVSEIDGLLLGTELHMTVKEDKAHLYDDWKEFIQPLMNLKPLKLKPDFFGIEQYLAARSLIASRSFQIDEHHGSGMVPLADLFNHKTAAEDVHFTAASSASDSEDDKEDSNSSIVEDGPPFPDIIETDVTTLPFPDIIETDVTKLNTDGDNTEIPMVAAEEDFPVLEMILVKDVKAGSEVFNTYGTLGNAALLHRYGFTEEGNPFDLINIDLELVLKWSSSAFSNRHGRARLSLWRRLDYSGCVTQDSEYFDISYNGEPQFELIVLLNSHETGAGEGEFLEEATDKRDQYLTEGVCNALLVLADIRDSLYGPNSMEDDIESLRRCCPMTEGKVYHSLRLRVSERRILERLRSYVLAAAKTFKGGGKLNRRKKPRR